MLKDNPHMTESSRETLLPAYFGEFGGQFVPESLIPALDQLEQAFVDAMDDESFQKELADLLRDYLGRPTPITEVHKLGGKARIFLKREDLVHGGAHKTNQVLGDRKSTPELQSRGHLVCRLLLEKKKKDLGMQDADSKNSVHIQDLNKRKEMTED